MAVLPPDTRPYIVLDKTGMLYGYVGYYRAVPKIGAIVDPTWVNPGAEGGAKFYSPNTGMTIWVCRFQL